MDRLKLAARRAAQLADRAVSEFFDDGCPQRAAAISYFAVLSLFPLAILAVAGIGLVVDDQEARDRVVDTVLEQLPLQDDGGRMEIEDLLREVTSRGGTFSAIGAIALVLSATGVMAAIRHALNAAWDVGDPRPPVQGKLIDILLIFGFGVLVTLSLALTLVVRLTGEVTDDLGRAGEIIDAAILQAGELVPLVLALITFTVLFAVVPARPTPLRDVWPGVLVATAGYELAKAGFALYLEGFARYGTIYASLGAAVAFMVFVWVTANVALLGAEAAAEWPAVREGRYDGQEGPPLRERVEAKVRSLFVAHDSRPEPADEALSRHPEPPRDPG